MIKRKTAIILAAAMILSAASCTFPGLPAETTAAVTTTAAAEETQAKVTTAGESALATDPAPNGEESTNAAASAAPTDTEDTEAEVTTEAHLETEAPAETEAPVETTAEPATSKPGIFDNIGVTTTTALEPNEGIDSRGNKYVDVVFDSLPTTYEEFIALPQASLSNVYDTAAMTVLALCFYPSDPELSIKMYEYVSGPRTINSTEYSFIKDRFMDYDYIPRSYFTGAVPSNDYKPSEPYTVRVSENPYTYENEGYAKMFLTSGGADTERFVMLRKGKDDKWYLWEQFILVGIREPESASPWA